MDQTYPLDAFSNIMESKYVSHLKIYSNYSWHGHTLDKGYWNHIAKRGWEELRDFPWLKAAIRVDSSYMRQFEETGDVSDFPKHPLKREVEHSWDPTLSGVVAKPTGDSVWVPIEIDMSAYPTLERSPEELWEYDMAETLFGRDDDYMSEEDRLYKDVYILADDASYPNIKVHDSYDSFDALRHDPLAFDERTLITPERATNKYLVICADPTMAHLDGDKNYPELIKDFEIYDLPYSVVSPLSVKGKELIDEGRGASISKCPMVMYRPTGEILAQWDLSKSGSLFDNQQNYSKLGDALDGEFVLRDIEQHRLSTRTDLAEKIQGKVNKAVAVSSKANDSRHPDIGQRKGNDLGR
ncbi:hypothetical protein JTE88_08330 [Arcanobacterium phocisimile]|uniref:Uncharacterized protein n=1 Tax=Arcanobacterium phocisimile TaxID=1302235 RepID=A0ABX7IG07_9ACTO|nr:hypothetical protein [Arcanobacterium phocisimile]QRV02066.1 hypothetical protein JTE88_08330 [Arcanobacterium phocisimile]